MQYFVVYSYAKQTFDKGNKVDNTDYFLTRAVIQTFVRNFRHNLTFFAFNELFWSIWRNSEHKFPHLPVASCIGHMLLCILWPISERRTDSLPQNPDSTRLCQCQIEVQLSWVSDIFLTWSTQFCLLIWRVCWTTFCNCGQHHFYAP